MFVHFNSRRKLSTVQYFCWEKTADPLDSPDLKHPPGRSQRGQRRPLGSCPRPPAPHHCLLALLTCECNRGLSNGMTRTTLRGVTCTIKESCSPSAPCSCTALNNPRIPAINQVPLPRYTLQSPRRQGYKKLMPEKPTHCTLCEMRWRLRG